MVNATRGLKTGDLVRVGHRTAVVESVSLDELWFTDTNGTCRDVAGAELVPLTSARPEGAVYPNGAADVIAHVRREADALVRRVNPGCDYSGPWFAPKVAEVAETMVRRICLDNVAAGRDGLARKIRLAWERSEAA